MTETLKTTRLIAGAMAAGSITMWIIVFYMAQKGSLRVLVMPSTLAGIVSPVIGYQIYRYLWEHRPSGDREATAAFVKANIIAFAVVEAASIFGAVSYLVTEHPLTCIGLFTQVLLTGAIWPNEQRLQSFLKIDQ